jgi:hypothetical protein
MGDNSLSRVPTAKYFTDSAAGGDMNLCGLCALCGEFRRSFTTEDTDGTEKIGSERGVYPQAEKPQ